MYFVYIMASAPYGTVTNDLLRRGAEHRNGEVDGFSKKYKVKHLVYYEPHDSIEFAIQREKQIKSWNRDWKIELIEKQNPDWEDLYPRLTL